MITAVGKFVAVSKMCFLHQETLIVLTVIGFSLTINGAQTSCTNGWFGPKCQYQCHCARPAQCDKHDGSCSSGCHQNWFGPACQYARMGFTVNGHFNSSWLTDNKDTTCNRENPGPVTVTLDTPIPLTWLRVVAMDAAHLITVNISYRNESSNSTQCPESNTAEINRVTMDISCPTEYPVTSVTLSGQVVKFLCSLYISAGRNVALKQRVEQSSWLSIDLNDRWWAEYAVDGRIPNKTHNSSRLTCSHTALEDKSPWWNVSFTQPVGITRFILEKRRDCCPERLKNFSLTVYPVTDSYKPITARGSDKVKTTYSVVPSPRISFPVREVKITEGFNTERFLTLCEVFIFGEIACPSNRFGLRCEQECNCVNQTSCFVHSGGCPSGCAPGYTGVDCSKKCETGRYGIGCTHNCSVTCGGDNNKCDQTDGTCTQGCDPGYTGRLCEDTCSPTCGGEDNSCNQTDGACTQGCDPGYTGKFCQSTCPKGKYGVRCSQNCTINCAGPNKLCHHIDGNCSSGCETGFRGHNCSHRCLNGTYGDGCEIACSDHCAGDQNSCHHVSGACDQGCDPGYRGSLCLQECPAKTWGDNCSQECSTRCDDSKCHHVTGACVCLSGFWGFFCKEATVQLGIILGAVVIALIICAIIVGVCLRRRRKAQVKPEEKDDISLCEAAASVGDQDGHEPSRTREAGAFQTDSHNGQASTSEQKLDRKNMDGDRVEDMKLHKEENMEKDREEDMERKREKHIEGARVDDDQDGVLSKTAVPVQTLNTYIRQHATDSYILEEFSSVPMVTSSPRTAGLSPQNVKKNRYKNIIPYNSTRVLLQRDHKKNQSDYINASYVKGYSTDELFIASQAPSDRSLNDFVRMIWEQRVDRVVMLTNLTEEGKKKCSMYWPVDSEENFGDVSVRLLTTHVFAEYTIRNLRLSKSSEPARNLIQFHFTAWPDKSVPASPWSLVDFHQRVMAVPGSGPVLVHCSAGVGRTGTFIGLWNLLKEAETTGKMDFRSVLWKLRQDRMHTIQTAEQYAFLHKMALVGHMAAGTTIKVKDMYPRLATREACQEGAAPSVSYRQEFEALLETCDTTAVQFRRSVEEPAESVYQNMSSVTTIRSKDRLSNIVPNERYRAELRAETQHDDTYINAVFVPNLTKDGQDLLTQLPLPSTVTDFWRLVTQFNVGLVVAFDLDSMGSDDTIGEFLPKSDTEPFENERYVVESRQKIGNSLVSEVTLTVHQKAVKILDRLSTRNKRPLTLLMCESKHLDPECALELHKKIKSCKAGGKSRVVYMCRNGADHCGLMCVQSILLDRLEADQCLTVPLVVGGIKAIRPQVIPSYDQYKCLYSVLKLAHESQNVYGNVGDVSRSS